MAHAMANGDCQGQTCRHACVCRSADDPKTKAAIRPPLLVSTTVYFYFEISTSLVSRRNKLPTTNVNNAITIGYHRPW